MQPGDAALYLDPLLPLWIRAQPSLVPRVGGAGGAAAIVLCGSGSYRLRNPDIPGTAVNQVTRRPVDIQGPGIMTVSTSSPVVLRAQAATRGWLIVPGRRLLDELAVAAFGEPGFCRFLDGLSHPAVTPCGAFDAGLPSLVESLAGELDTRPPAYRVRARSLLTDLLLSVYRSAITATQPSLTDGHHLSVVIDHIEMNYAEQLSLEELAAMMGTSPTHFSRVFRREVGVPLFEFINRTRIRKACQLLRRTDLPVTRIAVDVGYNNVSFFNRYFRRIMRLSPREYRRSVNH